MKVNYIPALMGQIRARRGAKQRDRIVTLRTPRGFVPQVDPVTRRSTGEPQQFVMSANDALRILPGSEHVADPLVVEVDSIRY